MLPVSACRIVRRHRHDPDAFTQGLVWDRGDLIESTGLVGRSRIRRVRLRDGKMLREARLPVDLFGEGIALWGEEIVGLTWQDGIGFRRDRETLEETGRFEIDGEGWGLTGDGESLILSDGTPTLRFLDPATMAVRRRLLVVAGGRPIPWLNELQWRRGEILANVLSLPAIARIDPASGQVKGWIDIAPLVAEAAAGDPEKVANGIAWDEAGGRLFVTGKNWPTLFEIA
ncbi:MAG TPA: glutaminyl-peptide cyclotransferase [Allosphingosinicella sp.]|nr:glutaminyl-peptide cyclotransferase [Allosphingosinicella sp.]